MAVKGRTVKIKMPPVGMVMNEAYIPLLDCKDRYLVLKGGGSSGKSVFVSQKMVYRTLTEKKHRFLVIRKVAKTLRDSVFAELKNTIHLWGADKLFKIPKGVTSELYLKCGNGNEILFSGLDDVERLKSIQGITGIWIEEATELTQEDFRQLDIRLRGKTANYKQIILSFNPIYITHWLKGEFFDEQHPKEDCTTLSTTYKDNKFLDKQAIKVLEGFKETDPYYYMVYCLGRWGVVGKTIFDAQKVTERLIQLQKQKPLKEGFFAYSYKGGSIVDSSIQWVDEAGGYIRIYEEPRDGYPYVIGGDTAGDGSDYFAGQVINNATSKQVATFTHQFDEDLYARQMYCLGRYYNNALIGIETNFSTYPVKELQRLGYPRQYMRQTEDSITHKVKMTFGFRTDRLTRPVIISELVGLVREHPDLFNDVNTLEEMLTFVRNESGKAEAQEGAHDDLIMALAIAYYVRGQQVMTIDAQPEEQSKKLIDILGANNKPVYTWQTL